MFIRSGRYKCGICMTICEGEIETNDELLRWMKGEMEERNTCEKGMCSENRGPVLMIMNWAVRSLRMEMNKGRARR